MTTKLFLILGLAALGALAHDVEEVEFTLEGKEYSETVVNGADAKYVVVRKQGVADHTVIMHDFKMNLTVFKDLTTKRCVIIPLNRNVAQAKGILFKDKTTTGDESSKQKVAMDLEVDEESIDDVAGVAGKKIADLCREFPSFRARIVSGVTGQMSGHKRVRRAGWLYLRVRTRYATITIFVSWN